MISAQASLTPLDLQSVSPLASRQLLPNLQQVTFNGKNLDACQGDCDSDLDCLGDLVCFQADGGESVPGCAGLTEWGYDYCFKPTVHTGNLELNYVGGGGSGYGECEGDCDNDQDCMGSLKCFQRDLYARVPNCDGSGEIYQDYCYDPDKQLCGAGNKIWVHSLRADEEGEEIFWTLTGDNKHLSGSNSSGKNKYVSTECLPDDACYTFAMHSIGAGTYEVWYGASMVLKDGAQGIVTFGASCIGADEEGEPFSFSIPEFPSVAPSTLPSFSPSSGPSSTPSRDPSVAPTTVPSFSFEPSAISNLQQVSLNGKNLDACQGDCDSDLDCLGDLVCFQADGGESVPGCAGLTEWGYDYCFKPTVYTGNLVLKYMGEGGSAYGECEGDCDSDEDCIGSLKCFQRDLYGRVPNCDGSGVIYQDYCYVAPTNAPSVSPSKEPSSGPSQMPSTLASSLPSTTPTMDPSSGPSKQPTSGPSSDPSSSPSVQESMVPSTLPTVHPSENASDSPSQMPSTWASSIPSGMPTMDRSPGPSEQPTRTHSDKPSSTPSIHPIFMLSLHPNSSPIVRPSIAPTGAPSELIFPDLHSTLAYFCTDPSCQDNSGYLSIINLTCHDHLIFGGCSIFLAADYYTDAEFGELVSNCPCSCQVRCGGSPEHSNSLNVQLDIEDKAIKLNNFKERIEAFAKLKQLLKEGVINQAEFEKQKNEIMV